MDTYIQTVDAYGSLVDQSYYAFAVIPAHAGIQGLFLHKGNQQNPWIPDRVGDDGEGESGMTEGEGRGL